ncbi:hypothetical protein AKO1_006511 [Acrasis kona]|uniref:Endonuclease/exonuclease/phosphatase domain-containing protein n=1 Tax=Acrasis kona TaxID=1008807 RepID=A0AAW2ZNK1_9EUKA
MSGGESSRDDSVKNITNNKETYELRLGQFNVLNLQKENVTFYHGNRFTPDQVVEKVNWIGGQLKKMKACIVGFEEVFDHNTLLRATRASGLYKDSEVYTANANGHSPTVGLASKFPVLNTQSIIDFPKSALMEYNHIQIPITKFSRPVLRASIQLPYHITATVFVVHSKSKKPMVPKEHRHEQKSKSMGSALSLLVRTAEAVALRHIIIDELETNKNCPLILLGDLNDDVHSVTTEIISGTQPWKSLPTKMKNAIWETLLWSTSEIQVRTMSRDVQYSHIHNGRYDVLDHIMVSGHFVRSNPKYIGAVQYVQMFNDHLVDETLLDESPPEIESDHGQVVTAVKLFSERCTKKSKKATEEEDSDD